LDRQFLVDLDQNLAALLQRVHHPVGHAVAGVRFVGRDARIFAAYLDPGAALHLDLQHIV